MIRKLVHYALLPLAPTDDIMEANSLSRQFAAALFVYQVVPYIPSHVLNIAQSCAMADLVDERTCLAGLAF